MKKTQIATETSREVLKRLKWLATETDSTQRHVLETLILSAKIKLNTVKTVG